MDYFCYFLLFVASLSSTVTFTGADVIRNIIAFKGKDCALPCSRDKTLELSLLEWSHLDKLLLVFRGAVQEGYEDPLYTNRVELQDPQLQTNLSVVLKNVSEKDRGLYRCKAVNEDGEKIQETSQFIHLTIKEETTSGDTNTELSLGLILGLFALILIVLCVWFRKQIKEKLFGSSECSALKKSKEHRAVSSNSSSSLASSSASDGPRTSLIRSSAPSHQNPFCDPTSETPPPSETPPQDQPLPQ